MRTLLLVVLLAAAHAHAQDDGLYACHREERATASTIRMGASDVSLGARLTANEVLVQSTQNDNARYYLSVRWSRRGDCGEAALRMGGAWTLSSSYGSDDQNCTAGWELDPQAASRAAALLHVQRTDRHPIGQRLSAAFEAPRSVRAGQPIEITVTIASPAGAPVVYRREGGSNRGPRDNQFDFTITRDGQPVAPIEGWDFGGLSQLLAVAPGTSAQLRTALAPWGDVSVPGHYEVRCSYTTELSDHADPYPSQGQVWDRRFEGVVRFEVVR